MPKKAAPAPKKKAAPPKKTAIKPYPKGFEWFQECSEFRAAQAIHTITDVDSPEIWKVDLYIKKVCDGLLNHKTILDEFDRSALKAFHFFVTDALLFGAPLPFLLVLKKRLEDDLFWRALFRANGPKSGQAQTVLRKRGLLR